MAFEQDAVLVRITQRIGNGFLIGGETNLMTAGVAERAGYPLSFAKFAKVSIPVTLLTLLVGSLWLLLRFEVLGG